jgi:hypothetical protein
VPVGGLAAFPLHGARTFLKTAVCRPGSEGSANLDFSPNLIGKHLSQGFSRLVPASGTGGQATSVVLKMSGVVAMALLAILLLAAPASAAWPKAPSADLHR